MVVYSERYLLAILASKAMRFFNKGISASFRGGYLRFFTQYLEINPIPKIGSENKKKLGSKVEQILTSKKDNPEADTTDLESKIDQLVYELYGLSEEEIGIVEGER